MQLTDIKKNMAIGIIVFVGLITFVLGLEQQEKSFEQYKVIVQRNIFSRYHRITSQGSPEAKYVTRQKVINLYVLRGVSTNGQDKLAFIEDQISGQYIRAKIGDDISVYKIKDITADSVTFENADQQVAIKVGSEIYRQQDVEVLQNDTVKDNAAQADNTKDSSSVSSEDELLKKMMERRDKELQN